LRRLIVRCAYIAVLAVATGLFTFELLSLRQNIGAKREEMSKIEEMVARLAPDSEGITVERLVQLSRIKGSQLQWGEKLRILCERLPHDMWLEDVALKKHMLEGVSRQAFVLSGSTRIREEQDGLNRVLEFLNDLRSDADFSKGFESVGLLSSKRNMAQEKKVLNFEFICPIIR
jgi:hypothetical protein